MTVDAGEFDWSRHPDKFPHLFKPMTAGDPTTWIDKFGTLANFAFTRSVVAGRLGTSFSPFNAYQVQQASRRSRFAWSGT